MAAGELEVPQVTAPTTKVEPRDETVFDVLTRQARRRTTWELRTTAIGCAFNAMLLVVYHPSLTWLASAFAAASAYGVWGLADRLRLVEEEKESPDRRSLGFLRVMRFSATVGGSAAALWAAFRLMAAALGGWQH